ncbi:olfactory receptor 52D1-like [Sphaerodactylus townsendi]|uniref:olfactory receptor 52D1-like n=1 Tax=Sphaerodactylus townsendi TaxID=933632 RepID=UPI0020265FC5|nr:olfactory receptor 52D1-like [Sphaerodactylus townsendi]
MSWANHSSSVPQWFFLVGVPGLEEFHLWFSIPLCLMYAVALLGNLALLVAVALDPALHQPMYVFLAMLAATDVVLSCSTVPKALSIFWFRSGATSSGACLAQVFFVHFASATESGILLAMAFDRYVAICKPLRHASILPRSVIQKIGLAVLLRGFSVVVTFVFLLRRLPYCGHQVIPHTYCEHMGVARLACADITVNVVYGLTAALSTLGVDSVLICVSYVLIVRAVFRLPSKEARLKALDTCGSHLCVILMFYTPAFFSFFTHRFGHSIPRHLHILLANLYVIVPPMLNPVIYGVKTKRIREGVARWFLQAGKHF